MWTKALPTLVVLVVAGAAAPPLSAQTFKTCEYTRDHPIPTGSTMEEQFKCYKDAGRKVSVYGTSLQDGALNGAGCIVSIATDRVQVASCTGFTERALTIPFASIRLIHEESGKDFVTVFLRE